MGIKMNTNIPFIKLLSTPRGKYIYDVNRDEIVSVSEKAYHALQIIVGNKKGELDEEDTEIIEFFKSMGYLSDNHPSEIKHSKLDYIDDYLDRKIAKMTLQLTQACNLRCSYCVYSDINNESQRTHSAKRMSFETAKKAVDFLWEHSVDSQSVNIGFYGGEPVIEFNLMKQVVEYAEELFFGKRITFSITTNGTLFNDEIIEYLVKHDINLAVSLDGPEEIHNKSRRFAANGQGSFQMVSENMERLRKQFPEYYNRVLFSMVVNPQNDFNSINTIFTDYDYMNSANVSPSIIDDIYSMEKVSYSDKFNEKMNYHLFLAFLSKLGRVDGSKVSPIALQEINQLNDKKANMGKSGKLSDSMAPGGPCIPGHLRLLVNTEGNFYPCERVSESSEVMNIGNADDGFNIENAKALLNVASITAEKCRDCWALIHCNLCAKQADDGNCLNPDQRLSYCDGVKDTVKEQLLDMIALEEACNESIVRRHV